MIEQLFSNIRNSILNNESFKSCYIYPNARGEIIAPAVFLEVANYSMGSDPATEELALIVNVEARVVVDSISENAELICQHLACQIANIAHLNSFGCNVTPAKVSGVSRDYFKPEFDAYICWLVEWSHQFHLGTNVWIKTGITPHTLFIHREEVVNG